jgi:hypothetical protein
MSLTKLLNKSPSEISELDSQSAIDLFKDRIEDRNQSLEKPNSYSPAKALVIGLSIGSILSIIIK